MRLAVLQATRIDGDGTHHERIGTAIPRRDGTIAVYLDRAPRSGLVLLCADESRHDDRALPPIPRSRDGRTGARLLSVEIPGTADE